MQLHNSMIRDMCKHRYYGCIFASEARLALSRARLIDIGPIWCIAVKISRFVQEAVERNS